MCTRRDQVELKLIHSISYTNYTDYINIDACVITFFHFLYNSIVNVIKLSKKSFSHPFLSCI